jgi:hypothetical protein
MSCFKIGLAFVIGFVGALCLALLVMVMISQWVSG